MRRRIGLSRNALIGACLLVFIHTVAGTKLEQSEPVVISTTDQDSKFTKVTENVNSVPELVSVMMDDKDGSFKLRPNNATERLILATEEDAPKPKIQTSTSISVSISGVPLESDSVIVVEDVHKPRENVVVPRHVILSPTPESSPRTQTKERAIKAVDWNGDSAITETPRPGNFNSFESILDAYNVHRLAQRWRELYTTDFTKECAENMNRYLTELKKGTLWAIKMTDSSGRYNSGFFWGNQYWMGSASLCNHMDYNTTEENTKGATVPPFRVGFYSLRLRIALPHQISPSSREFQLGVCLPYSCSEKDVRQIVDLSAKDDDLNYTDPRNVQILRVHSPHDYYDIWQDRTTWILLGVSALMCVMIALGTGYDLYLLNKKKHFFSENYTYEISRVAKHGLPRLSDSSIVKAELGSPFSNGSALRRSNGDLAIYNPGLNTLASSPTTVTTSTATDSDCSTKRGLLTRLLLSFSVRQNMKTICDQSVGSDTIPVIHGLRSISMAWVILGHTCIVMFKYSDNMEFREVAERHILFQTITNGPFSVDTFFFISGLLVSYLYFRTMAKIDIQKVTFGTTGFKSQFLQFLGLMGYRYGRLTVPYLFVLGMVEVSMKWLYYNSIFEPPTADHFNCPNYWWRNALYINTLFPVQDMCMLWSWYLADDTQFYILGVILLMLAIHHFRTAAVMLIVFLISSVCTTAFVAYINEHIPSTDDPLALFDKIYDKPWTRLGPYLVGMAVGWILFRTNSKIKMSKVGVVLGWVACIACLLSLVYGLYGSDLHPIAGAAYSSLSHTVWALALSWIVIACSTGYGGYVNKLLSATILYPFSRVTYCAYLVHPIMIRLMAMKADSPVHLTIETVVVVFSGQLVVSYVLSFIVSLAFEAPVVQLLKLVSPDKRKK